MPPAPVSTTPVDEDSLSPEQQRQLDQQLQALQALQSLAGAGGLGSLSPLSSSPATNSSMEAHAARSPTAIPHSLVLGNAVASSVAAVESGSTPRSNAMSASGTPRDTTTLGSTPRSGEKSVSSEIEAFDAGAMNPAAQEVQDTQLTSSEETPFDTPFGEETLPPPPPEGLDPDEEASLAETNGTDDGDSYTSPYTTILDGQTNGVPGSNFSLLSVLGREDQTGPPPPGLAPLPGIFHPTRAPPPLPAGIVHPDQVQSVQSSPAVAETSQEDKKKSKKPFGSLFGSKKDDKEKDAKQKDKEAEKEKKEREKRDKEEREKREKEEKKAAKAAASEADEKGSSGLMSGLKKKFGAGMGGSSSGGSSSSSSGPSPSLSASGSIASSSYGGGSEGPSPLRDRLDLYSRLMELLCRPDLHLLNITASLVKRGDVDKQSRAWVHLLTPKGRMVDLLGKVIFTEVDKTDHEGTLFRNNTFSVGLMSAFAHEVGRGYLKLVLGPLLHQILTSGRSYEINPEKAEGGPIDEDTIDNNTMNLIEACGAYVDSIVKSLPDVPLELRRVCTMLRQFVQVKFPNSVNTCVGGFFFLRFLTPAVVSPEGFGVQNQDEPISIEARRPLILISKTLQQISNEMYFSEDHMMSLNSFITENIPAFQQFFQDICSPTAEEPSAPQFVPYSHEANKTRDDALIKLHAFLHKSLPEIKAVAQVEPAPPGMTYDPIVELERILNDLGEPPDAKILKTPAAAAPVVSIAVDPKKKK
jgi:hypothetical protein